MGNSEVAPLQRVRRMKENLRARLEWQFCSFTEVTLSRSVPMRVIIQLDMLSTTSGKIVVSRCGKFSYSRTTTFQSISDEWIEILKFIFENIINKYDLKSYLFPRLIHMWTSIYWYRIYISDGKCVVILENINNWNISLGTFLSSLYT